MLHTPRWALIVKVIFGATALEIPTGSKPTLVSLDETLLCTRLTGLRTHPFILSVEMTQWTTMSWQCGCTGLQTLQVATRVVLLIFVGRNHAL